MSGQARSWIGETLHERYTIQDEIGEGGMARVYRALDRKHDRPVAIKVMRPEIATAIGPERFLREIAIAARLQHPHILSLIDSGEAGGALFFVMPYLEGETLAQRILRDRQLAVDDVVRFGAELISALGYAHERGVLHRDIKPGNIMITGGHAVVMDFGVARVFDGAGARFTQTGLLLGTPAYMAPELMDQSGDVRSDLYAVGCVLFEMLTGGPPFTGPSPQAVLARHASQPVPAIAPVRPEVPRALEAIVMRCLAKSPADRFADMEGLARELQRARREAETGSASAVRAERPGPPSANLEAYELYLKGVHRFNKRTESGNRRAIERLEQAVRLEPAFALALAALAEAYVEQFFTYEPTEEWEEKAFVAIERARQADPGVARLYVAKGNLLWTRAHRFPHAEALAEYRRALALDPDSPDALNELGRVLWHIGQLDPAVEVFERVVALDPAFIDGRFRLGWLEQQRGHYQRSLELLRTVPRGSLVPSVDCLIALSLWYLERREEARATLARVPQVYRANPDFLSTEAIFLALEGDSAGTETRIDAAVRTGQDLGHFHHIVYNIAAARALLGQTEPAFESLCAAAEDGFPCYPWFERDPLLESLRAHPRFGRLVAELKARWEDV